MRSILSYDGESWSTLSKIIISTLKFNGVRLGFLADNWFSVYIYWSIAVHFCLTFGIRAFKSSQSRLNPNRENDEYDEEVWKLLPTGRIGETEEIANLATFVSSDYASWLSGFFVQV